VRAQRIAAPPDPSGRRHDGGEGRSSRYRYGILRACLGGTLLLTACIRVAVEARAPEPFPTRIGATTVWVIAWGLAKTPKVTAECGDTHVYKATVHTTFPGFLLGLVTLGFVVPARVEYICAAKGGPIQGAPPPP
jgi:hypothetical protein